MVTGVGTVAQPTAAMGGSSQTEGGLPTVRRASDNRRSNKPIMEKRRRARINNCLNELKTLILDAMKKDPARHSKLEKADILEMTVKHLETLQRRQAGDASTDKFRAGFSECAGEVGRFPGLEPAVRRRLLQHLAACLAGANKTEVTSSPTTSPTPATALQVHILPTPPVGENVAPPQGILFTNGNGASVQLVPTRLPNGDIALVLPASLPQSPISPASSSSSGSSSATPPSPLPVLVPIPPRTSAPAPPPPQTQPQQSHSVPLALVVRKTAPQEHDKPCWRPW